MEINYSKPSIDIEQEEMVRLIDDVELFNRQVAESNKLLDFEDRKECVLCARPLMGESFIHRDIPFVMCGICGHVQTKALPLDDYPQQTFGSIYPMLDTKAYNDRKKRIYKPKLHWIVNCLQDLASFSDEKKSQLRWVEMGTGAGYFISCLVDEGIENITGFDADKALVDIANTFIPGSRVSYFNGNLSDSFDKFPADIYVAFFVLEHISDAYHFFQMLKQRPKGTLFVFSVPVFGFSCLFENIFKNNYARNLDAVLHTQLYTERSIEYIMRETGYEILAEWVFGQDAMDLTRFMLHSLSEHLSGPMLEKVKNDCIRLQDSLQHSLDLLKLSDQRHLVAIRR